MDTQCGVSQTVFVTRTSMSSFEVSDSLCKISRLLYKTLLLLPHNHLLRGCRELTSSTPTW